LQTNGEVLYNQAKEKLRSPTESTFENGRIKPTFAPKSVEARKNVENIGCGEKPPVGFQSTDNQSDASFQVNCNG